LGSSVRHPHERAHAAVRPTPSPGFHPDLLEEGTSRFARDRLALVLTAAGEGWMKGWQAEWDGPRRLTHGLELRVAAGPVGEKRRAMAFVQGQGKGKQRERR
jgi:hypothetical protein